nr:hypothetical protein GCM10025699_57540 [Microbacterium flavescens]
MLVDREVTGASSVVADTATAFGALVSRFVEQGHERIAYLGGPDGSWQNRQRTAAVVAAAGGLAELTVLGPYPSTFEAGVRASADVLASGATAVVPYATAIGLGLMYVLRGDEHRGRSLTVSSERMVVDALGLVGVPAIDVDGEHLGRVAAERLIEAIASGATPSARRSGSTSPSGGRSSRSLVGPGQRYSSGQTYAAGAVTVSSLGASTRSMRSKSPSGMPAGSPSYSPPPTKACSR